MSVNLCVDWGNTRIKAAIFDNGSLKKRIEISEETAVKEILALKAAHQVERAVLCSVADHPADLAELLQEQIKSLIVVNGNTPVPINNAYSSPETLGPDRLALVCGAYILYPGQNNLVISVGTCATYDLVQKTKTFRGGSIAPGLRMRLNAMHEFTDKLPIVDLDGDTLLLGYDTATCMRSGAVFGMAAEIDGMIASYSAAYTDFNAILTGGDAPFFADKLKSKIFADPDLLLKGLNIISDHNASMYG